MIYLTVPLLNLKLMIVEVLAVVCFYQAGWWSDHLKISQLLHMLLVLK